MRPLLVLIAFVALAAPAAALSLPSLSEVKLPAIVEIAPADAAERAAEVVAAAAVASAEAVVPDASAKQLLVTRSYAEFDFERRAAAASSAAPTEADTARSAPMVVRRITSVEVEPPWMSNDDGTPVVGAPQAAAPVTTQSAVAPAPPAFLAAAAAVSLAAGGLVHVALAMYHRIAPSQALAHETRRAIHSEVVRRGAASAGEVAESLGLHPKTARYHLDLLVGFSLLARDADGAYRVPGVKREAEPTIEDAIVTLVGTRPGLNMAEVARELGVGKSTAQERVTKLLLAGRLESRRDERSRLLYPSAAIASVA